MDNLVVYVQCPHCKKGWYGKFLAIEEHYDENGNEIVDKFIIEGLNPTDLTQPIHCMNCHNDYTILKHETHLYNGEVLLEVNEGVFMVMEDFVARCLTTCKGS